MAKKGTIFRYNKKWRVPWWKVFYMVLLGAFVLLSPAPHKYATMQLSAEEPSGGTQIVMPTPAPYPVNVTGIYPGEEITASGIVALDISANRVLYKRNELVHFAPASTTKILTALVSLDAYTLDDIATVGTVMNDGQAMGLITGEKITIENLLYGALIHSGNDAAYALAEHYPGGVEKFVEAMNEKAREIYLTESHFTNPMGYDDENHVMTPMDLAKLARYALQNTIIAKMVAIPQITISDVTHSNFHYLKNVNELLGKIPGVGGIKTGWTEQAGENLVTLVERNGHRVILVVLHSQSRFDDTTLMIDWVFGNHRWEELMPPG